MSDKNKAIITVGLSIILLAGIFLYHGITKYNALMAQSIEQEDRRFHAHIMDLEKYSFSPYAPRIKNILQLNYKMVMAFANRNREMLYHETLPIYEALKGENPSFQVMHFHLPDGTTFLRMHNPDFFGDDLRQVRPIIEVANRTKKQHSGFEVGRHGPFYRIVQPVFIEDTFIGILEFGIKVHQLLEAAEANLSDKATTYFLKTEWQKVDHQQKNFTMKSFGEFSLNTHNSPLYTSIPFKIDLNHHFINHKLGDKVYVLHNQPIFKNYRQEVLGGIIVPQDITHLIQARNKFIIQMSLLVLLLTSLSLYVLYVSFNKLVRSLGKSQHKLQDSVVALTSEVKERVKAENRALVAQSEWEKTFNAIPDIITIQDKNMHIIRANQATFDFFAQKKETLLGQKCYHLFSGCSEPCPMCPLTTTLKDTHSHAQIIVHEGLGKTFLVSSCLVRKSNKELKYLVHVAKDITQQKQLEEELFQAQKMEAIGTLAGGIAHDFNNILAVIIGYSEIAKADILAGIGHPDKDIDQVLTASRRATELVKQILTFSRKTDHLMQPLSPHLIVKEAIKMLRSSLPSTISIQQNIDSECGNIMADPTKIHQIVVNLCTNALQAMADEKGSLGISLTRKGIRTAQTKESDGSSRDFIVLSISDTGHGMDQKTIKRIFEPYFTTKEKGKGTGLGLAVIHGIVEECKGFIEVESEPGKGTTFQVHIPILEENSIIGAESTDRDTVLPQGTERILLVDDEEVIVSMTKKALEDFGYTVTATTDSLDTLKIIRTNPDQFDLLITDQTMPNMTGTELAQEALRIKPNMPIILCTGYSSVISEDDALAIGIKQYARKPVDRATLAEMVRQVLDENKISKQKL